MSATAIEHEQALLRKHYPRFRLHPNEEYFPIGINEYLQQCTARTPRTTIREYGSLTPEVIDQIDIKEPLRLRSRESVWNGSTTTASIYGVCTRKRDVFLLQYIMFFAYNGPYTCGCCCCCNIHGHPADFEHVTIVVDRESLEIEEIRLGQHGREAVHSFEDFTVLDHRPYIYIAKNNHAMYSDRKVYKRRCFLRNDTTLDDSDDAMFGGTTIDMLPLVIVDERTPWLRFTGDWGGKTYSPMMSNWWRRKAPKTTNAFWRMFCC